MAFAKPFEPEPGNTGGGKDEDSHKNKS